VVLRFVNQNSPADSALGLSSAMSITVDCACTAISTEQHSGKQTDTNFIDSELIEEQGYELNDEPDDELHGEL